MKHILLALILTLATVVNIMAAQQSVEQEKNALQLTAEEQQWLKKHPVIRVSNEPDYAPFDFVENGEPAGFSIDYLDIVARRAGHIDKDDSVRTPRRSTDPSDTRFWARDNAGAADGLRKRP